MLIHTIPGFCLQYDEALHLLRVHWNGGPDMRPFRSSMDALADLAQALRITHCLLEMDSFPDYTAYDQIWLGVHWVPKAVSLTHMQQAVFTIRPERVYQQLTVESLLAIARPFMCFDVQFFLEPTPALDWLSQGSARLPALLHEWAAAQGPAGPDRGPAPYAALRPAA